jgi:sugar O-acyltransferase (sialic acid O-acetyltransferase NeuD family)
MTKVYGIYGSGGHGRETLPFLRDQVEKNAHIVFVEDTPLVNTINGHRVLSWDQFVSDRADQKNVTLAIGNGKIREALDAKCRAANLRFVSVIARSALILDMTELGEGAILSAFALLTSNIRVGRHFHANSFCSVAHDCVIGDYVTFGPGVRCNGNVIIEDHAYVGSGALIRQGKPGAPLVIGRGAVVGMGAVVTKSVAPGVTVVGNPARPLQKD